jgi:hypothetical protein
VGRGADVSPVTADSGQSRAAARRRSSVAVLTAAVACAGGFVLSAAAPAAAAPAVHWRTQPHATATATMTPTGGKGHGHGGHGATGKAGGHGSKSATSSPMHPHAVTKAPAPSPSAGHTESARSGAWVRPAGSAPVSRPASTTSPAAVAAAAVPAIPAWRRDDSDHANRGVVRAFTTGLRSAGQTAGFPALLIAVMVVFLLIQHRLDRRDEKLSRAEWTTDQGLEFSAPTTIRTRATIQR